MLIRARVASALATMATVMTGCSLLVSSEGYVESDAASVDAARVEASVDAGDGPEREVPDASPYDVVIDAGKRCLSSDVVDAFERATVEGNGWTVLANTTTSQLEISQAEFVSATRSLRIVAKPVDAGLGSAVYMSRPVGADCVDLTMKVRIAAVGTDFTLLRIATLGAGNAPALRARVVGSSLLFVEESLDIGSRDLGSIPLGTNTWRTVHVHYERAPGLALALDGTDVPLTNAPTVSFSVAESVELGVARRVGTSAGTFHVDDVVLR